MSLFSEAHRDVLKASPEVLLPSFVFIWCPPGLSTDGFAQPLEAALTGATWISAKKKRAHWCHRSFPVPRPLLWCCLLRLREFLHQGSVTGSSTKLKSRRAQEDADDKEDNDLADTLAAQVGPKDRYRSFFQRKVLWVASLPWKCRVASHSQKPGHYPPTLAPHRTPAHLTARLSKYWEQSYHSYYARCPDVTRFLLVALISPNPGQCCQKFSGVMTSIFIRMSPLIVSSSRVCTCSFPFYGNRSQGMLQSVPSFYRSRRFMPGQRVLAEPLSRSAPLSLVESWTNRFLTRPLQFCRRTCISQCVGNLWAKVLSAPCDAVEEQCIS